MSETKLNKLILEKEQHLNKITNINIQVDELIRENRRLINDNNLLQKRKSFSQANNLGNLESSIIQIQKLK